MTSRETLDDEWCGLRSLHLFEGRLEGEDWALVRAGRGAIAWGGSRMNWLAGCEGEGLGTAVLVGFEVGRMCWRAGNAGMERWLAELQDGHTAMTYRCSAGVVTRRRAEGADHYYVLNDGAAGVNERLHVFDAEYARGEELITGRELGVGGTWWFELPAGGAAWLRMERKG